MGCICSKVMSKSISFREELNQSLHKRSNSISSLQQLIISGCTSNNLQSHSMPSETPESSTNPKSDTKHTATRLVQSSSSSIMDVDDLARRSKSCHWFPEYEVSSVDSFNEIKEDHSNTSRKVRGRSRSIHTVEEYDAFLERIWLSRAQQQTGIDGEQASTHNGDLQKTEQSQVSDEKEKISTETDILSRSGLENVEPNSSQTSSTTKEALNVDTGDAQDHNNFEKGFKRKAIAKGLESLTLPQPIEFPNIGSRKDLLQEQSPEEYVTPKFGSYSLPTFTTENECNDNVVFNPELVAAFEECMQQLEAEEETILRQIVEDLEEESTNDKLPENEGKIPPYYKDIQVQGLM